MVEKKQICENCEHFLLYHASEDNSECYQADEDEGTEINKFDQSDSERGDKLQITTYRTHNCDGFEEKRLTRHIACQGSHPFASVRFAGIPLGRPETTIEQAIIKGWVKTKNLRYSNGSSVWICPLCAMHLPKEERCTDSHNKTVLPNQKGKQWTNHSRLKTN